jgi:hypothetical protein
MDMLAAVDGPLALTLTLGEADECLRKEHCDAIALGA